MTTGYNAMPELIKRQYANNKAMWEGEKDKSSDIAQQAHNANQQIRDMYGIGADDMNYRGFTNNVINGGLRDSSNKYMKKLDTPYQSPYQKQLELDANAVRNFQYNPNNDPNFKAYADMYARQGAAAQDKTYSNLTALSGGRNNSWASAATAQVGQAYAQKTADMIPQLAEQAYNKLLQQYNVSRDLENTAYGRYSDQWNRDKQIADTLYDKYNTEWNRTLTEQQHTAQMRDYEQNYATKALELKRLGIELEALPEQIQVAITSGKLGNTAQEIANALSRLQLQHAPQQYQNEQRAADDAHNLNVAEIARVNSQSNKNNRVYTGYNYGVQGVVPGVDGLDDDPLAPYYGIKFGAHR